MNIDSCREDSCLICGKSVGNLAAFQQCPKQNISTCRNYLQKRIVFSNDLNVAYKREKNVPICSDCYPRSTELLRIHIAMEEIQKQLDNFVEVFSEEILIFGYHMSVDEIKFKVKEEREDLEELYDDDSYTSDINKSYRRKKRSVPQNVDIHPQSPSPSWDSNGSIASEQDYSDVDENTDAVHPYPEVSIKLEKLEDSDTTNISKKRTSPPDNTSGRRPSRKAAIESAKRFSDVYKELYSSEDDDEEESGDEFIPEEEPVPRQINLTCKYCEMVFENVKAKAAHLLTHVGGEPCFKCGECDQAFRLRGELNAHTKEKHLNERLYVCEQCGKAFRRPRSLLDHQNVVHAGHKPHRCDECGKCFGHTQGLKMHREIHHSEQRRVFLCTVCGKAYKTGSSLRSHMDTHKGVGAFTCHICEQRCTSNIQINIHQREEHAEKIFETDGTEAFMCKICDIRLKSVKTLTEHFWRHNKEKHCSCSLCGKSCGTRNQLLKHMRGHNMNLKFQCTTCGTRYSTKKVLDEHESTHMSQEGTTHV